MRPSLAKETMRRTIEEGLLLLDGQVPHDLEEQRLVVEAIDSFLLSKVPEKSEREAVLMTFAMGHDTSTERHSEAVRIRALMLLCDLPPHLQGASADTSTLQKLRALASADGSADVRAAAAVALANFGDVESVAIWLKAQDGTATRTFLNAMCHPEVMVAIGSAKPDLSRAPRFPPTLIESMCQAVRGMDDPGLKKRALTCASYCLTQQAALDYIMEQARQARETDVRTTAVLCLAQALDKPAVKDELIRLARSDDHELAVTALTNFERRLEKDTLRALGPLAGAASPEVAGTFIYLLRFVDISLTAEAVAILDHAAETHANPDIRRDARATADKLRARVK